MTFDRHAILKAHYAAQIAAEWRFDKARAEAREYTEPSEDGDCLIGRVFIGTCFAIMPSGKYYMPWTSNQTRSDETRDAAFMEAFEEAIDAAGGWLESGEGDPCDMFFCCSFDADGETEEGVQS